MQSGSRCTDAALLEPQTGGSAQYMRHASGQFYGVSAPVARYIKQNAPILHHYANEVLLLCVLSHLKQPSVAAIP